MIKTNFSRSLRAGLRWAVTLGALVWLPQVTFAQTPVVLSPVPKLQFFDANGRPLSFGCVFSYQTLSTTPLATYTSYAGNVQNANPVILNAGGFVGTGGLWLQAGMAYRLVVKAAGGSSCSSGSTISTVDGIGGGTTTLTTIVPYASTVTFADAAQNQLFELTLTGNATSNPLTAAGVVPPGLVTFEITQDVSGGHSFSWPANVIGGVTIDSAINAVTQQTFIWNGTVAYASGPATFSDSTASFGVTDLYDFGLSASLPICTDANLQLSSICTGLIPNSDLANSSLTFNGQTVALGSTGDVNAGAAAHSMTLNQGTGAAETGLALSDDQLAVGRTGADPVATGLCNGSPIYNTSTHAFTCQPANANGAGLLIESTTLTGGATLFAYPTAYSTTPACFCSGNNGSCNIAPGSPTTTATTVNTTVTTTYVMCVGAP